MLEVFLPDKIIKKSVKVNLFFKKVTVAAGVLQSFQGQ